MSQRFGPSVSSNEEIGRYLALGVLILAAYAAWIKVGANLLHSLAFRLETLLAVHGKQTLPALRVVLLTAVAAAVLAAGYRLWRSQQTRRTLRTRQAGTYLVLPTTTFTGAISDVLAFAEGLGGTQRAVAVGRDRPATAVRFLFRANQESELECLWQVPADAASALLTAGTAYGEVEALPVEDEA